MLVGVNEKVHRALTSIGGSEWMTIEEWLRANQKRLTENLEREYDEAQIYRTQGALQVLRAILDSKDRLATYKSE